MVQILLLIDGSRSGEQAQQADEARTAAEARVTPATGGAHRGISSGEKKSIGAPWAISGGGEGRYGGDCNVLQPHSRAPIGSAGSISRTITSKAEHV